MNRRVLMLDSSAQRWRLETLHVETLSHDPRHDYVFLSGEALCQYLLRRDDQALILARGPLPFISGNKACVGYMSPLTGLPHYSLVGGRVAAMLLHLGLDAVCFHNSSGCRADQYIVIEGYAPRLNVDLRDAADLPAGQRSAFYWLVERELQGLPHRGSVLTVGEGARLGYRTANLAADAIYHAGRGGAGAVFARYGLALVLRADPLSPAQFLGRPADTSFVRNPNALIAPLVERHCARLSAPTGGTIAKLFATGAHPRAQNTLPADNARQMGYALARLGSPAVLKAIRQGQTGCHWCQVNCRHWHWTPADYAPDGHDMLLDDFEPTWAVFAMSGLTPPPGQNLSSFVRQVEQQVMLPIEQLGCDVMDIGAGLAALWEGLARGLIPSADLPPDLIDMADQRLPAMSLAVNWLRRSNAADYAALRAVADGPQALADRYPAMQDIIFNGGRGTLGNAGHCNALWTFMMPFGRFFGHYVGQAYKVEGELPPPDADEQAFQTCFARVIRQLLDREFFWVLGNALSQCAFTFVIFSQDGQGNCLSDDDLLVRLLAEYGLHTTRADLEWFAQAFWAQSIVWKCEKGWRPPAAADLPGRVYEALSLSLHRPAAELRRRMDQLVAEWKRQAGELLIRFGYDRPW